MSSFLDKYGEKKQGNGGQKKNIDFDALKKERMRDFYKIPNGGKVSFLFLTPKDSDNPLVEWGQHKGLQEVDYWTVPCDHANKGEQCEICDQIAALKEDDLKGNEPLYKPIALFYEEYARVVPINEKGEYEKKAYWFRVPKNVLAELVKSEKNLEEDEKPFYDRKEPSKIIIEFDDSQAPATKYSATIKPIKASQVMSEEDQDALIEAMKPLTYYTFSKKKEALLEMFGEYLERKVSTLTPDEEQD